MPSVKRRSISQRDLSPAQKMELVTGRGRGEALFTDDAERRESWFAHRDELMTLGNYRPGHRPFGWWAYEASEPLQRAWWGLRDTTADALLAGEAEQLYRMGELDDEERVAVEAEWTKKAAECRAEAKEAVRFGRELWKPYNFKRTWQSVAEAESEARRMAAVPAWWTQTA